MLRCVYRTSVPVDDGVHELTLTGPILHVATRQLDEVEVWHLHNAGHPAKTMRVRVVGTGHPLPDDTGPPIGSAIVPGGALVWHLFEVP